MNAMIDDAGIVNIGMSKKQAEEFAEFLGYQCVDSITEFLDKHSDEELTLEPIATERLLYDIYDVLIDVLEDGEVA